MQLPKVRPSSPLFFFFLFWTVGDGGINPLSEEMEVSGRRREPRAPTEDHGPKRRRFGLVFYLFLKQKTPKRRHFEVYVFFFKKLIPRRRRFPLATKTTLFGCLQPEPSTNLLSLSEFHPKPLKEHLGSWNKRREEDNLGKMFFFFIFSLFFFMKNSEKVEKNRKIMGK